MALSKTLRTPTRYTHRHGRSQHFQFLATQVLNKSFPCLEALEDIALPLEEIHPDVAGAIINKSDEVLSSTHRTYVQLSTHIAVDEVQGLSCTLWLANLKRSLLVLSLNTGSAEAYSF